MWLLHLIPNVYVRPACYMKSRPMNKTASVTDKKSFSGYGALHHACSASMWSRPNICNNITKHVEPYPSIRVLRAVPFHYFKTTSLNWDFFNCTIGQLYPVGNNPRHPLKRRPGRAVGYHGRFGYTTKCLLPRVSIEKCSNAQKHCFVISQNDSSRFNT